MPAFSHGNPRRNHPRIRGENTDTIFSLPAFVEASPHAWGILEVALVGPDILGIIPICMGNTGLNCESEFLTENHPHVHGGIQPVMQEERLEVGNIPA